MKRVIALVAICMTLTGCADSSVFNRNIIDTTWNYKYADIKDVGTVEVDKWMDYDESDMIQITAKDGTTYLTHSANVILRTK